MKRKDFNVCKAELKRLLSAIDNSFVAGHVYDKSSSLYLDACSLRYVADCLCKALVNE